MMCCSAIHETPKPKNIFWKCFFSQGRLNSKTVSQDIQTPQQVFNAWLHLIQATIPYPVLLKLAWSFKSAYIDIHTDVLRIIHRHTCMHACMHAHLDIDISTDMHRCKVAKTHRHNETRNGHGCQTIVPHINTVCTLDYVTACTFRKVEPRAKRRKLSPGEPETRQMRREKLKLNGL